jgi:hypothetical protein
MVLQREDFNSLKSFYKPRARELFAIDRGQPGRDKDDWVIITNLGLDGHIAESSSAIR